MNIYWIGGLFASFVLWSGFIFYGGCQYESYKLGKADAEHDAEQAQVTISAQEHVIKQVQTQNTINQGVENAYNSGISSIDGLYAAPGMQSTPPATSNGVRPIAATSCGSNVTSWQVTKKFKLTPKQCDVSAERLIGLQKFETDQRAAAK